MAKKTNLRLMAVAILVVLIGTSSAWAFSGTGSGVSGDPYIITTVEQLQEMQNDLAASYVLGNDIDASATAGWNGGQGFEPIGTDTDSFYGRFDGQNHAITGLSINLPSISFVALFGCIRDGVEIKNVTLMNFNITGYSDVGTLVGYSGGSTISNCSSGGTVKGIEAGGINSRVGGLVGRSSDVSIISKCYSTANVSSGAWQVGGLAGYNGHGSVMSDCYATGNVSGSQKVGGLVGDNLYPEGGYITRCYSTGKVTGNGGGLIGYNFRFGITYDSYWDIQTSGKTSSKGGTGKSTTLMKQEATFVGWDFDDIWEIDEDQSYPYFKEPRVLVSLDIVGPDEVVENSNTNYKAIAHYDNNSTKDVTNSADWSVEPNDIASITAGLLTTEMIDLPMDVTITAQYAQGDIAKEAQKDVSIFAICPSGSALEFDGVNDYIDCGNDASLNVTELTWALWIKRGETTYSNERALISNTGPKTGPREASGTYALQIDEGGQYQDKIQFVRHGMPVQQCPLSETAITDTNWHHIAVTRYINGDVTIYIDGYEDATGYLPERTAYGKTLIGTGHESYSNFKGTIDEVAIFDRALSAEEIQILMHTRPDTGKPNLIAYWDFDEGEGQIAHDLAGNNDGLLGSTGDIDDSDPNWVESDAPIGICTLDGLAERNILNVLGMKNNVLDILDAAIAKEEAFLDYMDDAFHEGAFGDLKKGDVAKAKQKIHSAIQQEEQAETAVDQSIDKLDDALDTLGIE